MQNLVSDIENITKSLDHETFPRIQLENKKQSRQEEIHFLKELHLQEIDELKQVSLIKTSLDPTILYKHALSNVTKGIRKEYQQRNELESSYEMKVMQTVRLFWIEMYFISFCSDKKT